MIADPGGDTGWVLAEVAERGPYSKVLEYGQLSGDHYAELYSLMVKLKPNIVICERFENRNDDFAKLMSLEYIGVVKLYRQNREQHDRDCKLIMQGASEAKGWSTDDKLERMGLLIQPKTPWRHANDAMRHYVYWLCASPKSDAPILARSAMLRRLK